jgi:hypothetical protein
MDNIKTRKLKNYYSPSSVHGIRNNLAYYKQLRQQLESHKTKHANIEFRKKVIDNQRKLNYQLEYDRLRNDMYNKTIIPTTIEALNRKRRELETLTARDFMDNGGITYSNASSICK